mmetsp:Transcript_97746/g.298659  ORF Transcript_97746/g.298659 Transcript_97746/m.298659 type:complete len:322 (+) Transcript_97746:834-1799(+)
MVRAGLGRCIDRLHRPFRRRGPEQRHRRAPAVEVQPFPAIGAVIAPGARVRDALEDRGEGPIEHSGHVRGDVQTGHLHPLDEPLASVLLVRPRERQSDEQRHRLQLVGCRRGRRRYHVGLDLRRHVDGVPVYDQPSLEHDADDARIDAGFPAEHQREDLQLRVPHARHAGLLHPDFFALRQADPAPAQAARQEQEARRAQAVPPAEDRRRAHRHGGADGGRAGPDAGEPEARRRQRPGRGAALVHDDAQAPLPRAQPQGADAPVVPLVGRDGPQRDAGLVQRGHGIPCAAAGRPPVLPAGPGRGRLRHDRGQDELRAGGGL